MASITVQNLKKSFGEFQAVQDLSFTIADGEFVFFLGPSGCGKTTTLRMVAGLLMPSDGRIEIGGRNVTYLRPRDRNVGMVFQSNVLYHHLSVFENLAYPLKVRGLPRQEVRRKVEEVATLLQISDTLRRGTDSLSAGQAQRVAIGRMLVRQADVFLMDEPISHLDAKLRAHMRIELRHLQKELNQTTLFVSHDQLEAMSMADRIAVMNQGVLQQFDTPQNIFDRPANVFVASFVGEPHMNILQADLVIGANVAEARADGMVFPLDPGWLARNRVTPGTVTLGIRPEHLVPAATAGPGSFPARVEVIEPLGAETLFTFDIRGQAIKLRCANEVADPLARVDVLHLSALPGHVYLFDRQSGATVAQAAFAEAGEPR